MTETTTISYSYDPLARVTGASYVGSLTNTYAYAYDAVGNRTVQTQTITSTLVTNYGYDIANRLTSVNGQPYTWDDNGNLLNDGAQTYGYDQANRLKQVMQGAITTTFAYNGAGDRLQQTINGSPTRYVLDPAAGLTQVLSDGANTYLYGNARLGQYQAGMQYFGADGLGSVRQLYDASGQVVGSSRYDPYGSLMSQSGATSVFAFAGEQHDAATGLEYLRARYYSSAQGRFTTRDVWEGDPNAPMSYNAWNYVQSDPVNLTDPSGMLPRMAGVCPAPRPSNARPDLMGQNEAFVKYIGAIPITYVYCGEFTLTAYQFIDEDNRYAQLPVATTTNLTPPLTFSQEFILDVKLNGTGHSSRVCAGEEGYFTVQGWNAAKSTFVLSCGKGRQFDQNTDAYKVAASYPPQLPKLTAVYIPQMCNPGEGCRYEGKGYIRPYWPPVTVKDTGTDIGEYRLDIFTGEGPGIPVDTSEENPSLKWSKYNRRMEVTPGKGPLVTSVFQVIPLLPLSAIFPYSGGLPCGPDR